MKHMRHWLIETMGTLERCTKYTWRTFQLNKGRMLEKCSEIQMDDRACTDGRCRQCQSELESIEPFTIYFCVCLTFLVHFVSVLMAVLSVCCSVNRLVLCCASSWFLELINTQGRLWLWHIQTHGQVLKEPYNKAWRMCIYMCILLVINVNCSVGWNTFYWMLTVAYFQSANHFLST